LESIVETAMIPTTAARYRNFGDSARSKNSQADLVSFQQKISKLMVAARGISPALALFHASRMDRSELFRRLRMYTGTLKGKGSS